MKLNRTGEKILLTLWVGGHWVVGFMMVPLVRDMLAGEGYASLRGEILSTLFKVMTLMAVAAGVLLLLLTLLRLGWKHWRNLIICAVIAVAVVLLGWVYPQMAAAEAGSEAFGKLHGASMILYLVLGALGLALVAFEDDPRAQLPSKSRVI